MKSSEADKEAGIVTLDNIIHEENEKCKGNTEEHPKGGFFWIYFLKKNSIFLFAINGVILYYYLYSVLLVLKMQLR